MRLGLAYNLQEEKNESHAELLTREDVDRLVKALEKLKHEVVPIEVTGTPGQIVDRLVSARPELVFNVAEGIAGRMREALYPALYRMMRLPFTGSDAGTLAVGMDKRLTEEILTKIGIRVPRGILLTKDCRQFPEHLSYPLFIKPNYEGSSKGICQDSIAENESDAKRYAQQLLKQYSNGVMVEEYIRGRELTVPWLEAFSGGLLEIVEWHISHPGRHDIMDYEVKQKADKDNVLSPECPADLDCRRRCDVLALAERAVQATGLRDFGRIDIRLNDEGTAYFLEANALPGLRPDFSLMIAAQSKNLSFEDVLALIIRSAVRRYGIQVRSGPHVAVCNRKKRRSARQAGLKIGRFDAGKHDAITDVKGVKVGHVTHIADIPGQREEDGRQTIIRTGITAIVPSLGDDFNNHLVAGGFILNGIGEMSGLTQAMEWGWLETPILLTNTMSIGSVHQGIIEYMLAKYPELGRKLTVTIPLIGETDDSFLNDSRSATNTAQDCIKAIKEATDGPVEQGSVGGGTGMITFDFAGGIGSSSRVLPHPAGQYTLGVLVQSNFGRMRNLTVEGNVVGKEIDQLYPYESRRLKDQGSVVVVLATDVPMLSTQLTQISKRAALGLGRIGSHAAPTSGEIVFAFSTANRTSRLAKEQTQLLNLNFVTDKILDYLYEAAVEATEEAVLNAMFHSNGMDGRLGRKAPPIPIDTIFETLRR